MRVLPFSGQFYSSWSFVFSFILDEWVECILFKYTYGAAVLIWINICPLALKMDIRIYWKNKVTHNRLFKIVKPDAIFSPWKTGVSPWGPYYQFKHRAFSYLSYDHQEYFKMIFKGMCKQILYHIPVSIRLWKYDGGG